MCTLVLFIYVPNEFVSFWVQILKLSGILKYIFLFTILEQYFFLSSAIFNKKIMKFMIEIKNQNNKKYMLYWPTP